MSRKFILQAKSSLPLKYPLLNHNIKNTCAMFSCVGTLGYVLQDLDATGISERQLQNSPLEQKGTAQVSF